MENKDELKDKIRAFLEKKDATIEESYFLLKELLEDIWSEIQDTDDSAEEDEDVLSEFEDTDEEETEDEDEMPFEEDIPDDNLDLQEDDFAEEEPEEKKPKKGRPKKKAKESAFNEKKVKVK